jgi:glutamine amidotransferase
MVRPARLTAGMTDAAFYHVHSLACRPADEADVVGTATYGEAFASIVERGNVFGAQFHPEKSSREGLALMRNFAAICTQVPAA